MTPRLREILRFLIAGGTNTLLSYAVYLLLLRWLTYPVAYAISYVAGIVISYTLSSLYVYRVKWHWRGLLQFPLVYAVQFAIGIAVVWAWVEVLRLPETFAPLCAVVVSLPVTYLLSRRIVVGGARS